MSFCRNCGFALKPEDNYCPSCGRAQSPHTAPHASYARQDVAPVTPLSQPKASGHLNVGVLIWSILNFLIFSGSLVAVVAIILTATAPSAPTLEVERKRIFWAKVCNWVVTAFGILLVLFFFAMLVIGIFLE